MNDLFILSGRSWLSYMHTSKLQHNYISHRVFLGNSFGSKIMKYSMSWFPKSWSQTSWLWLFQQHILPGFIMTIDHSSTLQDTTRSNWVISKNSTRIWPWAQTNTLKWHYKMKFMLQQPKFITPKHLSAIVFLPNQLLLPAMSPSQIHLLKISFFLQVLSCK